jgi:uncharacterized membrane protein required for colicin V production
MIVAAIQNTSPWWKNLSFGWFDGVLLVVLLFGFWRGRKRGMSREALPVTMWLILVIGAGLGYQYLAQLLIKSGIIHTLFGNHAKEVTAADLSAYLLIAFVVFLIHYTVSSRFRERVSGSNAFGSGEYYLGMAAGTIRYACILIFFLALLNAPFYSAADIAASAAYKARWYGGGLQGYSGDFVPDLSEVQTAVFKNSVSGPFIKNDMSYLLIVSTAPVKKTASAGHY